MITRHRHHSPVCDEDVPVVCYSIAEPKTRHFGASGWLTAQDVHTEQEQLPESVYLSEIVGHQSRLPLAISPHPLTSAGAEHPLEHPFETVSFETLVRIGSKIPAYLLDRHVVCNVIQILHETVLFAAGPHEISPHVVLAIIQRGPCHVLEAMHWEMNAAECNARSVVSPVNLALGVEVFRNGLAVCEQAQHLSHHAHRSIGQVQLSLLEKCRELDFSLVLTLERWKQRFGSYDPGDVHESCYHVRVVITVAKSAVLFVDTHDSHEVQHRAVETIVPYFAEQKYFS